MTDTSLHHAHSRRTGSARFSLLTMILGVLASWRSRQALDRLDSRMLDDIGVTPEAAAKEARRAIWDVPNHWVK